MFGLAAACDYLDAVGLTEIHRHCAVLTSQLRAELESVSRLTLLGGGDDHSAIVTFSISGVQAHGVARILSNRYAIMVRSGFHCAQPLHLTHQLPETVRVSVHLYNVMEEIKDCARAVATIAELP